MPLAELNAQTIRQMAKALKRKSMVYRSNGDHKMFAAARRAASQIEKWWKGGAVGPCPVDLAQFDMEEYAELCSRGRGEGQVALPDEQEIHSVTIAESEEEDEERTLLNAPEAEAEPGWDEDVTIVQDDLPEERTIVHSSDEGDIEESVFPEGTEPPVLGKEREAPFVVVDESPPPEPPFADEAFREELETELSESPIASTQEEGSSGDATPEAVVAEASASSVLSRQEERLGGNGQPEEQDVPGFRRAQPPPMPEGGQEAVAEKAPVPSQPRETEAETETETDTQRRANHLREIREALRAGDYEEALRLAKLELTVAGLNPEERTALETLRDEAQAGVIERWMTRANEAYQAKRWEEALRWARKVLSLEENHQGALGLRQAAEPELERQSALQQAETVRQRVEQMLAQLERGVGVDIQAMEALVREGESLRDAWAAEGALETEKGRTFQQALQRLRERFDEKRKQHGQSTTADAVKSYEAIRDAIPEMEAALRRGETSWWDDRSGTYRPIVELLDEFRARLPELAREVALRHAKKAQAALKVHHPQEASEEIEQALGLDGLPNDVRAELEALQVEAQAELAQWQKASRLLEEARALQDPTERWKKILQAEEVYAHHENLSEAKVQAREDLLAWAQQYVTDALVGARALLQDEKFRQARRAVGDIRRTLSGLHLPEETLAPLWQPVEAFEQDIQDAEKRREAINAQAERIRGLLNEGEISQAYQVYKEAIQRHPDWEDDRVFGPLGRELRAKLGDREKLQEGWRLFERGHWEEAREAVKGISSEELQKEIRQLENAVAVAETLADIQRHWERGYYRDALARIDGLLSARGGTLAPEDKERLQGYKAEIEERRKGDREAWLQLGKVGLRSADTIVNAKAFAGVLEEFPEGVEGLEAALQMYQAIQRALAKPSTLDGYLRDAEEQLGAWIRARAHEIVEQLAQEGAWNEVKKWLDILQQHWPHVDRRWREGQYRAYFSHRAQALEQEQAWDELIEMWLEAQSVLPGVFEFVQREKDARREKLLAFARQRLMTARPGAAEEVIEELESDREVWDETAQAVYQLAQRLHDLDGLLQRGQLEGVRGFAEEILKEWKETLAGQRVLSQEDVKDFLDRRFTVAAQALLKEGDEAREDNPGKALIAYARGLQLPLPSAEQTILQRRLEAFGHLGERYVKELAQTLNRAEVSRSVSLQQQYDEVRQQRQQAWALLGVLPYLISSTGNVASWEKALREGLRRAESKAKALEMALKMLQAYEEGGKAWRTLLRSGQWERVRQEIDKVQRALGLAHPEIVALQDRVDRMEGFRTQLEGFREKVNLAYQADRFDEGLQSVRAIQDLLTRLDTTPEDEPFGIVQEMRLFDVEAGEMVRGLGPIRALLERRLQNRKAWEGWADLLKRRAARLQPDVEDLQEWGDKQSTAEEVSRIEATLAACEKAIERATAGRPSEDPHSDAAQKARGEGEQALQQLQEWRNWLTERHKERWMDMAALVKEAQELVDMGNFAEAMEVIERGLYYQPDHEFLQYLSEVTAQWQEEEARRSSSFFGRLWRRS